MKALPGNTPVRKWARRSSNPARRLDQQIRLQLPEVIRRLLHYQIPTSVPAQSLSRPLLTRLQRELRDATETSEHVAQDPLLQQFRKRLHLLLDH